MKDYLKSDDFVKQPVTPDWLTSLSENEISPAKTSGRGNIVMMNEYLKRKTPDQRMKRDWEKIYSPPVRPPPALKNGEPPPQSLF